jgi:hypothetical protein
MPAGGGGGDVRGLGPRERRGWPSRTGAGAKAPVRIGGLTDVCAVLAVSALLACVCAAPAGASAAEGRPFGIASFSVQSTRTREVAHGPGIAGSGFLEEPYAFTQAAGHPDALTISVVFDSEEVGEAHTVVPTRDLKDVVIGLPPGLVANPQAVAQCSLAQVLSNARCPFDAQVGVYAVRAFGGTVLFGPIVDVTPEAGQAAELALETKDFSLLMTVRLVRTAHGYGLAVVAGGLPSVGVVSVQTTLWGIPAQEGHDGERGLFCQGEAERGLSCEGGGLKSGQSPVPFLTMGSDCAGGPQLASVRADSWEEPGRWVGAQTTLPTVLSGPPQGVGGCEELSFAPSVEVNPETPLADEPLGLRVRVAVPQSEGAPAGGTPPLREATITLPQGVSLSAAVADGVAGCPATGPEGIDMPTGLNAGGAPLLPEEVGEGEEAGPDGLGRLAPGHCPESSTIGAAEALTPILPSPIEGRVYLAMPGCGGPGQQSCTEHDAVDGNLYRLYVELGGSGGDEQGVDFKLEGKVQANPATGQLTVELTDLPQLPLSRLRIDLNGGPRALLDSPATCGPATTTSVLEPWSAPGSTPEGLLVPGTPDAAPSSFYEVTGCAGAGAFSPGFIAGTVTPQAGAFSAFTLSVTRSDREQYLGAIQVRTPPGLSAMLSSVPLCETASANAGRCPEASRIGGTLIAAGAGSHPFQMRGSMYLTEGYEGAPFGLSIVTDAVAGPLNLGSVVIRARIDIDPETAALTITSDPLPQIVLGIPLRLQRVTLEVDRPSFIFNPTNCDALAITGTIASAAAAAAVSSPFAAAGCRSLPFKPKLTASTRGNGEFTGHGASLHVTMVGAPGEANIRSLKLDLPQRLPARLETIQDACPEAVFDANPAACPKASVIGAATVQTPILSTTMAGPAYLVAKEGPGAARTGSTSAGSPGAASSKGAAGTSAGSPEAAFPDIVLVLQAGGVRIDLTGALFVSENNITSTTFKTLPDVPIRRLDLILPEGPRSILAAGASLCGRPLHLTAALAAQNDARVKRGVRVAVAGCGHKKSKRTKKRRRSAHRKPPKKRPTARR